MIKVLQMEMEVVSRTPTVTEPHANKTISTLLLALTRRDAAGDFVVIHWFG